MVAETVRKPAVALLYAPFHVAVIASSAAGTRVAGAAAALAGAVAFAVLQRRG